MKTGDDDPGADSQRQAPGPARRAPPRQQRQQRASDQRVGQPHRRQRIAHRCAVGVAREQQKARRAAPGQADGIGQEPVALFGRRYPHQHLRGPGKGQIDQHFEPDRQADRAGEARRQSAAAAVRIGEAGDHQAEDGELPAVMIDPGRHEHAVGRAGEVQRDEGRDERRRADQPTRGQRDARQQHHVRDQRRDRDRHPLGLGTAHEQPAGKDQTGNRKVDDPAPVNIGPAERGVEAILAKVEPSLPV